MLISIHDKRLQRVAFIDNEKPETLHFFDDIWHRYLTEATSTFDFSVPKTGNAALQYLTEKNYVSFQYGGQDYLFNIMRTQETESELACYCENLNLELLNEMSPAFKSGGAQTFAWYFNNSDLVGGKNFSDLVLGINEVSDYSRSLEWEGTDTKLARLLSLVNKFDAECEFVTELNRDGSLKRIVLNVYKRHDDTHQGVGTRRQDVTLYYGKEIDGIRRTVDKTGLYNAIYPQGKDGLSITTVEKTEYDADGRVLYYTHNGQPYIYAPQTAEEYPAQISSKDDPWILYRWEYETENVNTLYGQALAKLKEISVPAVTYEVEGSLMLEIGDTVKIHDDKFTPTLLLEARVSEQEVSFSDPTKNKNVFSNFKALENKLSTDITGRLDQLIQEALPYTAEILSDNGTVFRNGEGETTLTARVLKGNTDMSSAVEATWVRADAPQTAVTALSITISATDVIGKAVYKFAAKNKEGSILATAEVTITHVLDGTGGEPGVSATAIEEQFYLSTSDTTPTGDNWQTVCPAWSSGKYIWSRYKCSWSDGHVTYTTPTLATGLNTANTTASSANSTANVAKDAADTALGEVSAVAVRVGDLEAENVTITNKLSATEADIKKLKADVAEIGDLSAVTADIENLKADVAEIDTALIGKADIDLANIKNGCITTAMIGTGVIGTTQIADGSITDAKIVGLTANKITAGRLDAAQIEVVNLNAANITVGTINGVQIAPGAIDLDKLSGTVSGMINGAVDTANNAQITADGKNKIYYQNTQPGLTGNKKGDTWFDTANGYRAYVWNGTAWSLSPFGSAAIADDAVTLAKVGADLQSFMDDINSKALAAQTSADGKNTVFYQATQPPTTGRKTGDTWYNTAKDNAISKWDGSKWTEITFGAGAISDSIISADKLSTDIVNQLNTAASDAATAKATADTAKANASAAQTAANAAKDAAAAADILAKAAQTSANSAQTTADGKNTVFYAATAPPVTGRKTNDIWFDTANGNRMYYWNGSAWTLRQFGTNALANLSITNALIANAAIDNAKIANLDAGKITTGTISADRIGAGSLTVGKLTEAALTEIQKPAVDAKAAADAAASAAATAQGTANTAKTNAATAQSAADAAKATLAAWCYNNNLTYIDGGDIYTGTVTAAKIAAGAITTEKLAANAVTAAKITAGTITGDKIAGKTISADKIVAGTITANSGVIANGAILSAMIGDAQIGTAKIANLAVTGAKIANATITNAQIADATIQSAKIAALDAGKITTGILAAARIAAGSITADKLASKSITVGQISDGVQALIAAPISMINGNLVYHDPTFASGANAVGLYNNSSNGLVTVTRISKPSDCPTKSGYCMQIKTTGSASPGLGGFVQSIASRANAVFIVKYLIKLPIGYSLVVASNSMGSGYKDEWLTSTAGTGKWTEYVRKVTCGASGTFSNGGHVYVTGSPPTASVPFVWYLGAIYLYDVTDSSYLDSTMASWCYNNDMTYINGGKIYTGSIAAAQIAANAIVAGKIAANAVTTATIAAGAINADKLAANSVNASKIVAGSITAAQLAANTITGDKIAATTIAAGNLAANSVTSDKIVADAVTTAKIAAKAVTANEIAAGTITAAQIAANAITATQLAAGAVTAAKIAAGQITADKIAAGAITADKFYGTAITSKNYVANSAGMKIDLANGSIDTKNFKVDSAGNVAMTGTLTMQGAQSMTVKNASASLVGTVAFKAVSGQTWSPGALNVLGKDLLHLAAGDASTTKAFVEGYAGGYNLFEMGREGNNYGVWMGTSATAKIGVSNAQSPQVYATGCTKKANIASANGFLLTDSTVTFNALGGFVVLVLQIYRANGSGGAIACGVIPEGYRPKVLIRTTVFEAASGRMLEMHYRPDGQIVIWSQQPSPVYVYTNLIYYI